MSVKEQVLQAIGQLPDDVDYRSMAERLAFLAAIYEAETDIAEGRVISDEQMRAHLELLEKRFADYEADPSQAATMETVFERLAERKKNSLLAGRSTPSKQNEV
jgi:putative addiction module component (TIGR02574 family)